MESEETAQMLRKKHQEAVTDFQDQIDVLTKQRQRYVNVLTNTDPSNQ